ncbi:RNA-binding KH domain-containing protein PEPPER-like [Malania oleifera]|uniref:RNA-binding KH domain-containing protein PEPPER-like n=1 Tax=Malania oleifera TaxID=397392 RepID=UPI0025AE34D1|nr:RNA-binding KH domain-containing protein PEPPER-like [Malania oleifera]
MASSSPSAEESSPVEPVVEATESQTQVTASAADAASGKPSSTGPKWPGWPGDNVFRLIVPVLKVGSIIGRKGELVKKMCDDTRARIRILDAPIGTPDRIVLISGKEETEAQLSPAMDAALRVFKRVAGLSPSEGDGAGSAAAFCSMRLLVASSQAINLIGKQGSTIKAIQEISSASVRVLSEDELPSYASSDERIVEIHGESSSVLKGLEAVLGHLRKFLVDRSVIPIFEKNYNATITQDRNKVESQSLLQNAPTSAPGPQTDYSLSLRRDPLIFERETQLDSKLSHSGLSLYGKDPGLALRSSGLGRTAAPVITQITQTMQVPLSYAEDIIGINGANISYIRTTSGAILKVQESGGLPDEITVEIKGTSSQVQTAQQLIQEFISTHKEPASSIYSKMDSGYGSSYSHLADTTFPSSFSSQSLGGYGSSGVGGYSSYRF